MISFFKAKDTYEDGYRDGVAAGRQSRDYGESYTTIATSMLEHELSMAKGIIDQGNAKKQAEYNIELLSAKVEPESRTPIHPMCAAMAEAARACK